MGRYHPPRHYTVATYGVLCRDFAAYRLAAACDPGWDAWAGRASVRLLDAAGRVQDRDLMRKHGWPGAAPFCGDRWRRDMLLAAGDILMCRPRRRGQSGLFAGSRRAAVRLIVTLCPDELHGTLAIFLAAACPDVHDEAGITIDPASLVPALADQDPEVRDLAIRAVGMAGRLDPDAPPPSPTG